MVIFSKFKSLLIFIQVLMNIYKLQKSINTNKKLDIVFTKTDLTEF